MATRSVPPPGRPVGDPPFEPHRIEVAGAENVRRPATGDVAAGNGLALVAVPMALSRNGEAAAGG